MTFGNGSLPIVVDGVSCLTSFNSLIRMRAFFNNSEITFTGPGEITLQCVTSSGTLILQLYMTWNISCIACRKPGGIRAFWIFGVDHKQP